MIEVRRTEDFNYWLENLKDIRGRARVLVRIERLIQGNFGDIKPVGEGVSELRIDFGPGYRVYFLKKGDKFIFLLAGGDKSSQKKDIVKAVVMARKLKE